MAAPRPPVPEPPKPRTPFFKDLYQACWSKVQTADPTKTVELQSACRAAAEKEMKAYLTCVQADGASESELDASCREASSKSLSKSIDDLRR